MKRAYTFALNCGYAEDGALSYTPFTSSFKYSSAKGALLDLAAFFKEQYEMNLACASEKKGCCTISVIENKKAKYCSNCGRALWDNCFDAEGFSQFISDICRADCNTYHEKIFCDEYDRWQPGGLEEAVTDGSLRFIYTAEKVMAAAVGHSPDDRVTIESIFKDRTKIKGKSFSFW